ncbi:PKD domain-containing protein [Segetibacter aerophilus]|uniref:PKD domain-containing protein n=1 Tax=Segetibacter aerophilus TaxID=670293 RepID=UPI0011BE4D22|nr:PKD domain-containing protein [Segetibacter aerophilus]
MISNRYCVIFFVLLFACSKKGDEASGNNRSPNVTLSAELIQANPFTFRFTATATDQEFDPLTYTWDFGEGTTRSGTAKENFSYPADRDYTVKVTVSDGKSKPAETTINISTRTTTITVDASKTFQTIEGFGGFGSQKEYWANGPFTSDEYVNSLINDLGLTILRDNVPTSFEIVNDNNDPFVTDLSKFNLSTDIGHDETLNDHLDHLRKMKAAGLQKLIASIWSPAPWMKHNNKVGNGTQNQNSAPGYTTSPTTNTNQLKTDMYNEFAEYCVAYIRIIKRETGLDVYALSLQNEPRFSQFYASCVHDGAALRDVIKVVGKRFRDEGIATKIFLPEDVGFLQGVESMVKPTLDDAQARQYASIVAVHGYDLNGVTVASPNAQTWQTMYNWGAVHNKPLWMTETSGFKNDYYGAMALAKAMYTAIRFGNVSAWLFWSLSTTTLDDYSLMNSAGVKSKRYYVSKNFYRYIRPGAVRIDITAPEESKVYALAFQNTAQNSKTVVLINDNKETSKAVRLSGAALPANFKMYVTTADDDTKDAGSVNTTDIVLLPPNSVVTLYKEN